MQKPPLYIYYLNGYYLNGGCSVAAPPPPPLAMPPCGGVWTSLRSGYSGGLSPTPQTPQRRPQRASAQGLRLRCAQLSAPKGLCPFRLRFHRQALVLARFARCAPARRCNLRLVAMSSRLEFFVCLRITHLLKVGLVHARVTRATSGIEDCIVSKLSETIHPTNSHRKP